MSKRSPLTFDLPQAAPKPKTDKPKNTSTRKHANDSTADKESGKVGREGRQFIAAHVLPEAAKQFKIMAVQQDTTTQALLIEAINDLFAKYGLSRIADN